MPRILNAMFSQEARASEQTQLVRLSTLYVAEGVVLLFCDTNYNVFYGGVEYTAFPFKLGGISTQTDGTIDQTTLTCANIDKTLISWLDTYDGFRGVRVKIYTTYAKFLDNTYSRNFDTGELITSANPTANSLAYVEDWFVIDSYTATEQVINFQLDPLVDASISIPRRRFTPSTCYWRFKDENSCKYSGLETQCNKSRSRCDELGNSVRFGGFPGVPDRTQRIWL